MKLNMTSPISATGFPIGSNYRAESDCGWGPLCRVSQKPRLLIHNYSTGTSEC